MTRVLALLPPLEHAAMAFGRLADDLDEVEVTATADLAQGAAALASARKLRWIQSVGTGVDHLTGHPGVAVSNVRGVHGTQMAEAAMAAMLALARDLPRALAQQAEARWQRYAPRLLAGGTVGILGVGAIAAALAPRLAALGMTVVGISGDGTRSVPGFDRIAPRGDLARVVADLDWLVLLTPYSAATHHLVDAAMLAAMKPTASLVNLARGGVVDEDALLAALDAGTVAGAALDVFATEPLPAGSRFWGHPRVIVTPHLGGFHAGYAADVYRVVVDNLRRYRAGGVDALLNQVDQP